MQELNLGCCKTNSYLVSTNLIKCVKFQNYEPKKTSSPKFSTIFVRFFLKTYIFIAKVGVGAYQEVLAPVKKCLGLATLLIITVLLHTGYLLRSSQSITCTLLFLKNAWVQFPSKVQGLKSALLTLERMAN